MDLQKKKLVHINAQMVIIPACSKNGIAAL
jgi:hypothetical protein